MVKLEVGPGYTKGNKGYTFNPHYCMLIAEGKNKEAVEILKKWTEEL